MKSNDAIHQRRQLGCHCESSHVASRRPEAKGAAQIGLRATRAETFNN